MTCRYTPLLSLALLSGLPLLAQAPATPREALPCEALRHKGRYLAGDDLPRNQAIEGVVIQHLSCP